MEDVFVLSAVRTPIGKYGGGLASVPPCDLAAKVVREAVGRAGVSADDVGHVMFGHVIHTDVRDMYISRVAAINGGLNIETPAMTVNRLCGSGMQAIVSAAQAIMLGDCEVAVAGGAESMSRAPYWLPAMRWGQRMSDGVAIDPMTGALSDPFDGCHMGVTAENVATDYHVSREDQDALATESHRRAAAATAAGYFKEQVLPIEIPGRKGKITIVDTDEHYFTEAGNGKPGLAELVLPDVTAAATAAKAAALAARIGLTAVISRDRPGFLIEALAYAQFNDAVRMFQDGYASPADIDTAMMLGCGYPRGPLQMLDEAGAAHVVSVLDAMHAATGDPAFTPVPLLAEYATAGSRFRAGARG